MDSAMSAAMESFVGVFVRPLPKLQRQKKNTKQALVQSLCCGGGVRFDKIKKTMGGLLEKSSLSPLSSSGRQGRRCCHGKCLKKRTDDSGNGVPDEPPVLLPLPPAPTDLGTHLRYVLPDDKDSDNNGNFCPFVKVRRQMIHSHG